MKLIVQVLDACDLMPKDGKGSSNPFVEVEFDGQRHRTQTKLKDLNPSWNETFTFNVLDPSDLPNKTIDVLVYHDRGPHSHSHSRAFLGRARISGISISPSESESFAQRYPLDKRGMFSNISGDISLRIYSVPASSDPPPQPPAAQPPLQPPAEKSHETIAPEKPKKVQKEVRSTYSIGTSFVDPTTTVSRAEQARMEPVTVMRSHAGGGPPMIVGPDYGLTETYPPLAARVGYTGDKITSTYDLVEQMRFLYVNVVKARDLPAMDITGSLDPYVEIKLGNYKGVTKYLETNQNPTWNQTFAFSRERLQANLLDVVVKDKDTVKDDFVGRVVFDISEVPVRVPPDSPLAPQWYRLEDKKGDKLSKGEVMLAVWMGTQADEAFQDAWHSDAHSIGVEGLVATRSKVYFSPRLCYLRIHVIEAQDLVLSDKTRAPNLYVRVQLGNQLRRTRPSPPARLINPVWDEEMMLVASEPFDEMLIITVEDQIGPGKDEPLGRLVVPVSIAQQRFDHHKLVEPKWYNLHNPNSSTVDEKKETKFSSKIHLRLTLDAGYHVLDESTHYSSDFRPSSKHLRKPSIGILELGILSARNLAPMKAKSGRLTDAYCVAKYGQKWVRTRTILDTLHPRWNEQYTWEVHDICTVLSVGVFDNCQIRGHNKDDNTPTKDQRIGKIRIRLSTLETERIYTHYYPLLVLQPSGLKKTGELHLAVRFTCTAWLNMVTLYARPLLPKMHYVQPISVMTLDYLRHQAMQIVAARLVRAEPPLRRETVEYMLDVDLHMWSLRRSKANFYRVTSVLSGLLAIGKWFDDIRNWRNPVTTVLMHVLFLILVCFPELILPTVFLYLFMIGMWNYRFRPRKPPHMDTKLSHAETAHPDELDEEFDTFPTSRQGDIVRMRYDRMRSVAGRLQTVAGDLATQGERLQGILSWRDPRATAIVVMFSVVLAFILYVTPFQVVAVIAGLYLLRHPKFRTKMPSAPFNFFKRLPSKSDMLL
ncbi:hypothetical protein QJS04_geneDACA001886 [Acorus gramineus]|uniref:C2 domain-containing protein n=1 Tax=Acorus gramineus TaxID=55184 RepID=A0AAV9BGB4_ACOGR|nr:hypothetical protein QJS04_geneDACA001886 [Acorus gramineus]